jgi:hypothetical protein
MRRRRAAACVAALVSLGAVATGCAVEGDDEFAFDARSRRERAADREAAEAMLPTLDDLPSGWTASEPAWDDPADEGDDEDDIEARLDECVGVDLDAQDNPRATSPDFHSPSDEAEASVAVSFTPSDDAAGRVLDVLNGDAFPRCMAEAVRSVTDGLAESSRSDGVEVGEPTFERRPFEAVGDESVAFRFSISASAEGEDAVYYGDIVLVRVGRIGISAMFFSLDSPFDEALAAELMQRVAERALESTA